MLQNTMEKLNSNEHFRKQFYENLREIKAKRKLIFKKRCRSEKRNSVNNTYNFSRKSIAQNPQSSTLPVFFIKEGIRNKSTNMISRSINEQKQSSKAKFNNVHMNSLSFQWILLTANFLILKCIKFKLMKTKENHSIKLNKNEKQILKKIILK